MRREALFGALVSLAIDDAGVTGSHACLAHQTDAAACADQALDILRANVVPNDMPSNNREREPSTVLISTCGKRRPYSKRLALRFPAESEV
jgi:hypothetical protein